MSCWNMDFLFVLVYSLHTETPLYIMIYDCVIFSIVDCEIYEI